MLSNHTQDLPPKKAKRKRYTGFIWPKDSPPTPQPQLQPASNTSKFKTRAPSRSHRWLDLLTDKGPDIFLGNTTHPSSALSRATWSQWSHVSGVQPVKTVSFLPWPFPLYHYPRRPTQVYDFAARKYKEWTPEWHPANYPCAYCCCVPWRSCRHLLARSPTAATWSAMPRDGHRWDDCYGARVPEATSKHECGCENCRMHLCNQQQQQQDWTNIADYRCDELS